MKRLELRKTKSILNDKREYYEIVAWYPNPDYNKQEEYIHLGEELYRSKEYPNWFVNGKRCFELKELCYTLCYWKEDGKLKTFKSRIKDKEIDKEVLKALIKEGKKKTRKLLSNKIVTDDTSNEKITSKYIIDSE